ncbi:hypothetical protein [Pseudomonas sp. NA-150]|uniref:hypothetical protein n=1 Tax=Pseudomonas sp. NA-150 TaxID=3367525 RepID=UPI0037C8E76A
MSRSAPDTTAPEYSRYWIKSFGTRLSDCRFSRLPTVIQKAKGAIPDAEIVGFLACVIERPPIMTGLMFCDHRHEFPEGLPARTPPVLRRYHREGYLVVVVEGGGIYVIAHWWHQNGSIGPFKKVH